MRQLEYFNGKDLITIKQDKDIKDIKLSDDNTIIIRKFNNKVDYIRSNYIKLSEV